MNEDVLELGRRPVELLRVLRQLVDLLLLLLCQVLDLAQNLLKRLRLQLVPVRAVRAVRDRYRSRGRALFCLHDSATVAFDSVVDLR